MIQMLYGVMLGIQTMALLILAQLFTRYPLTLPVALVSLLKIFVSYAPIHYLFSWMNNRTQDTLTTFVDAFLMSFAAFVVAVVVQRLSKDSAADTTR